MSTGDESKFAQRMRMRRDGTRPCVECDRLYKPYTLSETGTCSPCVQARLDRIEEERREVERQVELKRQQQVIEAHRAYVEQLRHKPLTKLDRAELLARGVFDGAFSQPQADDMAMRDVERYSDGRIRAMLHNHYLSIEGAELLNKARLDRRIEMSTPSRTGKTRKVLSEALQRINDGSVAVTIVVASNEMKAHYETQIQALIPNAYQSDPGVWCIDASTIKIHVVGTRGADLSREVITDPSVEAAQEGRGVHYAPNITYGRGR